MVVTVTVAHRATEEAAAVTARPIMAAAAADIAGHRIALRPIVTPPAVIQVEAAIPEAVDTDNFCGVGSVSEVNK
jgi:hypothetical protein